MATVTLFDQSSISPTSRYFYIDHQLTIVAIGMRPGDFITFEVVEANPAARAKQCGCDLLPSGKIALAAVQELTCPSCVGSPRPVTLTASNPVVILDYPQGFFIRAIYNGDGLQDGTVLVRAFDSDTTDVTPEMRGCPPICCEDTEERTWEPTGVYRCNLGEGYPGGTYEERERSNCGEFRWEERGPINWNETADTRCDGEDVLTRFVSQCGDSYWAITGTVVWNETNEKRCSGNNVQTRFVNQCGISEWRNTGTVSWFDTGDIRCASGNVEIKQENDCGQTRWTVRGPVSWSDTGDIRCAGGNVEVKQTNECGQTQWVVRGPATWSDTGDVRCVGGDVEAKQENECGQTQWVNRGPATWADTATTRCRLGVLEVFQQSTCGETRWRTTEETCTNYIPTLELFCGARAFRPTDYRDPAANVPLEGCCDDDPEIIGYIYPTPREGATTAVTTADCEVCETNEVLGYAVDWPNNLNCCSC